ncbi:unnamed protein product [Pedinophyceae sp. YPF-701]|nr:unnamed protein product [Pedinophyceae sp. YPF-701]
MTEKDLRNMMRTMDAEVDTLRAQIRNEVEDAVMRIQKELMKQLMLLGKDKRSMPMVEFLSEHGGSLDDAIRADLQRRKDAVASAFAQEPTTSGPGTVTRTTRKRGARAMEAAAAPSARKRTASALMTPGPCGSALGGLALVPASRMPRAGEMVYSENGSPIGYAGMNGSIVTPAPTQGGKRTARGRAAAACGAVVEPVPEEDGGDAEQCDEGGDGEGQGVCVVVPGSNGKAVEMQVSVRGGSKGIVEKLQGGLQGLLASFLGSVTSPK